MMKRKYRKDKRIIFSRKKINEMVQEIKIPLVLLTIAHILRKKRGQTNICAVWCGGTHSPPTVLATRTICMPCVSVQRRVRAEVKTWAYVLSKNLSKPGLSAVPYFGLCATTKSSTESEKMLLLVISTESLMGHWVHRSIMDECNFQFCYVIKKFST